MNDVQLHSFFECCSADVLESIFPSSDKQFITFDEMKTASDFEETKGHAQTISFWFQYLTELAKYVQGTVIVSTIASSKKKYISQTSITIITLTGPYGH